MGKGGRMRGGFPQRTFLAIVAFLGVLFSLRSLAEPRLFSPVPAPVFFTAHTVLWLGRTQVIPFSLAQRAIEDLAFVAKVKNVDLVEVLREPMVQSIRLHLGSIDCTNGAFRCLPSTPGRLT